MFGLEGQKKKKPTEEFVFDLEKELKDPQKYKDLQQRVEGRIQSIKEVLRSGSSDDEEFERFGLLLLGYHALFKVMPRAIKQKPQVK